MVIYKGIEYKTRTLLVKLGKEKKQITIAGIELQNAILDENYEPHDIQADNIDSDIYFYVDDVNTDAATICADGLDEPMKFIEEL